MKVKVCGITRLEQLQQLETLGVDFAGMIFYPKSARYIDNKFEKDKDAIKKLTINRVGVFVDADIKDILKAVEEYGLKYVQLHGNETPEYCARLMGKVPVIKALRVNQKNDINELVDPFRNVCDYILFDTGTKGAGDDETESYGGTGIKFDWTKLTDLKLNKHFFLSGGIELDDVIEIKMIRNPFLYAVDLNSRFETEPGVKDMLKIREFMSELNP